MFKNVLSVAVLAVAFLPGQSFSAGHEMAQNDQQQTTSMSDNKMTGDKMNKMSGHKMRKKGKHRRAKKKKDAKMRANKM